MFCQSFLAKTKRNGKMIRKLKNEVSKNREEIKFLKEEIKKLNKVPINRSHHVSFRIFNQNEESSKCEMVT